MSDTDYIPRHRGEYAGAPCLADLVAEDLRLFALRFGLVESARNVLTVNGAHKAVTR